MKTELLIDSSIQRAELYREGSETETETERECEAGGQQMASSGHLVTNKQVRTPLPLFYCS